MAYYLRSALKRKLSDIDSAFIPTQRKTINDLPENVLLEIFKRSNSEDLLKFKLVSRRWRELFHSKSLRKNLTLEANFNTEDNMRSEFPKILHYFGPLGYTKLWVRTKTIFLFYKVM